MKKRLFKTSEDPDFTFTLREFIESNWEDPNLEDMVYWLCSLKKGQDIIFRGGASGDTTITRVSLEMHRPPRRHRRFASSTVLQDGTPLAPSVAEGTGWTDSGLDDDEPVFDRRAPQPDHRAELVELFERSRR